MPAKNHPAKRNRKTNAESEIIATADFETDPFKYGRIPRPFCAGFFSPESGFRLFWGEDCAAQLVAFLYTLKTPHRVYFHNGGKFDFFLMTEHLENPVRIINGRIVKVACGIHTLQDSYAMIPLALARFDKDEIDYAKLESDVRENHRDEIVSYLRKDCTSLYNVVTRFRDRFGDKMTLGSAALTELRKIHPFDNCSEYHDTKFRPFYFGGRVEFFERGILKGDWKVYDVNSMYPYVMLHYWHPTGKVYAHKLGGIIDKHGRLAGFADARVYFARIQCKQKGAFPVRVKNAPLDFNVPEGEFFVTSHELKAALELGLVSDVKLIEAFVPRETIQFAEFVDTWNEEKMTCGNQGDKTGREFAKLIMNSSYGKTAQNPDNYFDFHLQRIGDEMPDEPYEIYSSIAGGAKIWRKKAESKSYYDVAIAASITGAARSVLLRAIHSAIRPVYCDTDSLICESLSLDLDASRLGAWKFEGDGDSLAIAGKKTYCLRNGRETVKLASKGARLTAAQIFDICGGKRIEWFNDAPTFSLSDKPKFVKRNLKLT